MRSGSGRKAQHVGAPRNLSERRPFFFKGVHVRIGAKPYEDILAYAYREPRKCVFARLGNEARDLCARLNLGYLTVRRVVDDRDDHTIAHFDHAGTLRHKTELRLRPNGAQKQHVIRIDHRCVGSVTMRLPNGAIVKRLEPCLAHFHIRETAEPHETIGIVEIAELPDDAQAVRLLIFEKLALEERDQRITLARNQRVLAQFQDRAEGGG